MYEVDANVEVQTEWGPGKIVKATGRSVTIRLSDGQMINIAKGTPGYDRLRAMNWGD